MPKLYQVKIKIFVKRPLRFPVLRAQAKETVINRHGVAGAVLQTALSLIN